MNAIPPKGSLHPDPDQWGQIEALATTLAPDQALWLSGYFAGLHRSLRDVAGAQATLPARTGVPVEAALPGAAARTLTILYATETGNSADLAQRIAGRAEAAGLTAHATDMASYKPRALKDEEDVLVVTSTHGEGDPPEPAADFFEFVLGRRAPSLAGLRFAVLGLGDSTYEFFCGASRKLDARLADLGAERLHDPLDCDVDYEAPASGWIDAVLGKLATQTGPAEIAATVPAAPRHAATPEATAHSKQNPFRAPILDNIALTTRDSSKETRHIELSLEGSSLVWEPGDALGLVPQNDPALVEALLGAAALDAAETVPAEAGEAPLGEALGSDFEIALLTPRFVEHWAELADAAPLRALLGPGQRAELAAFMRANHVIDLVRDFPVPGLAARDFTAGLRRLQPRLYSLASSASADPEEAHLTVSAVRYNLRDEPRTGIASGFLAERAGESVTLPVHIQSNPHFRLPADDATPIVMIGAGTGVAPYRAFLQEREARGARGPSWLFFGERSFRSDFLYQLEWQSFLKDGVLSRMDVAFSRDQAEKVYVHHRLRERGPEIHRWLEDGTHLYVCGDAAALAPDVHRALLDIVADQGGLGPDGAEEYLRDLRREGRYQRDVY